MRALLAAFLVLVFAGRCAVIADEPFRYPEGVSGNGRLRYVENVPVLDVRGGPAEIGSQIAELAVKPAEKVREYPHDLLKEIYLGLTWPLLVGIGNSMLPNFPPDHREEFQRISQDCGGAGDRMIAANTMFDILRGLGCATLVVEPDHSATGGPLFGRNLDFPTLGYLHEYSLLTIYHPTGKHAFASVGFPGFVGVLSGMNDVGLTVSVLEVYEAKDGSAKFNIRGTPYALCFRRLLEECATLEEAETLLRGMNRSTWINLAICDRHRAAVLEITPKTVAVRPAAEGFVACTNHFRSEALAQDMRCWRFPRLERAAREKQRLGIAELAAGLHEVNQGELTLQTMVFEPATLRLHLAFGALPSSGQPMTAIDLRSLLGP